MLRNSMDYKNKELCRLRTISFFLTLHKDKTQWEDTLYSVKRDVDLLLPAVQKAGYTLQSIRVITNPFGEYLDLTNLQTAKADLQYLTELLNKFNESGIRPISGGTDNHLLLLDITSTGLNGKEAQELLDSVGITVNKNAIPFDPLPPMKTSGIRVGTAAITTRGFDKEAAKKVAKLIVETLAHSTDEGKLDEIRQSVQELTKQFPLYE